MQRLATITSKRQLTIPAEIFRCLNFKQGQKVLLREENGELKIEKAVTLVNRLAGSVKIPKKYAKLSVDAIRQKAKEEYFSRKK